MLDSLPKFFLKAFLGEHNGNIVANGYIGVFGRKVYI